MKFKLFSFIYLMIFIVCIVVTANFLPAYASRLPWLLLVCIADIYFLWAILYRSGSFRRLITWLIIFFTFLPSILILVFFYSTVVISPVEWNSVLRTYLVGIAVALLIMRVPPLLAFLISDIYILLLKHSFNGLKHASLPKWSLLSFILSALVGIILIYGMVKGVYDFRVVENKLLIHNLPRSLEGYKIVQISDMHLGRWYSNKPLQKAYEIVDSLSPDLIVFTGDLVNYATSEAQPYKQILALFKAKDGVYAVLGNHDYGDYLKWKHPELKQQNLNDIHGFFEDIGWILLENRNEIIKRGNDCLVIAGTAHYSTKKYIPNRADLKLTLQNIPDSCITILLSHNPQITDLLTYTDQRVDIVLSGHTHALQIGFRFKNKEFSPASFIYRTWAGQYEIVTKDHDKTFLYVNRGLGHIMIPMRIGIRPEITLFELTSQN